MIFIQTFKFKYERSQASSVEIGGSMVVVGGATDQSGLIIVDSPWSKQKLTQN